MMNRKTAGILEAVGWVALILVLWAMHGCANTKPGVGLSVPTTSGARVVVVPDSGLLVNAITVQRYGWTWPPVSPEGDTLLTSTYTGSGGNDMVHMPPYARYLQFKKLIWRNTDTLYVRDTRLNDRMIMTGYLMRWGMALWGEEYLYFNATEGSKWQVILIR